MSYIDVPINICSLIAAFASAFSAWRSSVAAKESAAAANAANTLAKEIIIKSAQSELSIKILRELARIHRLMSDVINSESNDDDFINVLAGRAPTELIPLLKELKALSPKLRDTLQQDDLIVLLNRISSKTYAPQKSDLEHLQTMIDLIQQSQREELSNP